MFHGRIEFTGETATDVEGAIDAALHSIAGGNTSGFDRNESGSYTFEVNDGEPAAEPTMAELKAHITWLVQQIDGHCGEDHGGPDCISIPPAILALAGYPERKRGADR